MATFKNTKTNRLKKKTVLKKEKAASLALPIAALSNLTPARLGELSPGKIGGFMFDKRCLSHVPAHVRDETLSRHRWDYWNRSGINVLANALVDDADKVVLFFNALSLSKYTFTNQFLPSIQKNQRIIRMDHFAEGMLKYLSTTKSRSKNKKQKKVSHKDATVILKFWPHLATPALLKNNPVGLSAKLTKIKYEKSASAYRRQIKLAVELLPTMRSKTDSRKLLVEHPNLFRYLTVDIVEKLAYNPKEFVYVIKKAKPRAISAEIIEYLDSASFLSTITGDIKYTKILTSSLKTIKSRHIKDTKNVDNAGTTPTGPESESKPE